MYGAFIQKGDGETITGPIRVCRKQVEGLPPIYRALAELLIEQNTGDIDLVDG
ncbi:MAG: hypothetical protein WCK53_13010 [Methanomicrobiales archaeon]